MQFKKAVEEYKEGHMILKTEDTPQIPYMYVNINLISLGDLKKRGKVMEGS